MIFHMLLILSLIYSFTEHCGKKVGTYITTFEIHAESAALIKLRTMLSNEFSTDYNTMTASNKFFGGVFDAVNEKLEPYGVQLRANLTNIFIEPYGVFYDKENCGDDVAVYRLQSLRTALSGENRVVLFYCKKQDRSKAVISQGCKNLIGITLYDLKDLVQDLIIELMRAVSGDKNFNGGQIKQNFNTTLCKQVISCLKPELGLKNVRHLGAETYISGSRYQKREHDQYDDVSDGQGGDPNIYATQDYSNDEELFEDNERANKGIGQMKNKL